MEELKENSHRTGDITHTHTVCMLFEKTGGTAKIHRCLYFTEVCCCSCPPLPPTQRRLGDAAKKAISKLQVRTIRKGDQETEADFDNCAVCIEGYKANDVVRILPCR